MSTNTVDAAITLMIELIIHAQEIGQMVKVAKANGATTLSQEQWDTIVKNDKAARELLLQALAQV